MGQSVPLSAERSSSSEELGSVTSAQSKHQHKDNLVALIFMSPWILGFIIFTAGPMLVSLYLAFTNYDLFTSPEWTGLANFERLLTRDTRFISSLQVTGNYVIWAVPFRLLVALGVAMVLNKGVRGLPIYRGIFYLPSLLGGSVAIAILWRQIFGLDGVINMLLAIFGIEARSWIAAPDTALVTLILLAVWQFGSPMIIFLAGLKQIPEEYYEAAQIDGANVVQQFLRITIPLLTPVILFNLIMQMISAFQAFTPAYIISGGSGGPADSTLFYTLYLYLQGFAFFRMGYASAMAWILLAIIGIFTAINFFLSRYWVYYGDDGS